MNIDGRGLICAGAYTNRELDFVMSCRKLGKEGRLTAHQRKDMDVNLAPGNQSKNAEFWTSLLQHT